MRFWVAPHLMFNPDYLWYYCHIFGCGFNIYKAVNLRLNLVETQLKYDNNWFDFNKIIRGNLNFQNILVGLPCELSKRTGR